MIRTPIFPADPCSIVLSDTSLAPPYQWETNPDPFPYSEWTASKILIKPDYIETDRWFPVDSWMDGSSKLPGSVAQQAAAAATTNTVNTTNTQLQIQMHKYKHHKHTNTQVHKCALDSIVTHICSLLIFSIYRQSSSARSYIASKAWHQIPQAVPVSHAPAYIDPGPDPVPNNYNRLCRHLPSRRLCWNCSFGDWSAMSSYFREFHIFFRGIKFIVVVKCLWRKWALKST